jgi:hypothetical protein
MITPYTIKRRLQRYSGLSLILFFVMGSAAVVADSPSPAHSPARVATFLPVTHLLTQSLLQDTTVEVDYLPSKRYPLSRIRYWLEQKLPQDIAQLPTYTAVIEIASVWPEGEAYPTLRQSNIRIVPIDAAVQLKPEGARVSRQQSADTLDYFWLNSANLKVMLSIIAEDLLRLWPEQQAIIERNLQRNLNGVTRYAVAVDDLLWQQEIEGVCSDDRNLTPLLNSLSLPILSDMVSDVQSGNDEAKADADFNCLWISDKPSKGEQAQATWLINSLDRPYNGSLEQWLSLNLQQLRNK